MLLSQEAKIVLAQVIFNLQWGGLLLTSRVGRISAKSQESVQSWSHDIELVGTNEWGLPRRVRF